MKKAISILLAAAMGAAALTGCSKSSGSSSSGNTPLVLNEVAHSIFYAPQYAAIELGYFEDEGIAGLSRSPASARCWWQPPLR